jgi:hypothetical protein
MDTHCPVGQREPVEVIANRQAKGSPGMLVAPLNGTPEGDGGHASPPLELRENDQPGQIRVLDHARYIGGRGCPSIQRPTAVVTQRHRMTMLMDKLGS